TDDLRHLKELILRDAGDALDDLGRVAGVMLLEQLEYGLRVLQRHVALREAGRGRLRTLDLATGLRRRRRGLVGPRRAVVRPRVLVVAGEQAVVEGELLLHDERGVRVVADVFVVEQVVLQDVVDEAAEIRDVRADARPHVDVGEGRRPCEARARGADLPRTAAARPLPRIEPRPHAPV